MASFKFVISDPKTRKSYTGEVEHEKAVAFIGKKIGDDVSGESIGLSGYTVKITGGSDKEGFPMRKDVSGAARKKIILSGPPGFRPKMEGQRKRISVRGNTLSEDIRQVNVKVVKEGTKKLEEVFPKAEKKEEKTE
jgi:small subunit ribosomal protein S6e